MTGSKGSLIFNLRSLQVHWGLFYNFYFSITFFCELQQLYKDVVAHKEQVDHITQKAALISDPAVNLSVKNLMRNYEQLKTMAQTSVDEATNYVDIHQQFDDIYRQCLDWLQEAKQQLRSAAIISADSVEEKLMEIGVCYL